MALIQSKKAVTSGGGSSINVTFDSAVTRGNFVVVGVNTGVQAISTVTDSVGNTYIRAVRHATYSYSDIWYCKNALGGSSFQITATFAGSTHSVIFIEEWSNVWNVVEPLDKTVGASGDGSTSNTPTATTASTAFAKELVIVTGGLFLGSGENNFSVGAGYSNFLADNSLPTIGQTVEAGFESKEVSSTGAQTGTFGLASNATTWETVIATFKLSTQTTSTFTVDGIISQPEGNTAYVLGDIILPRPNSFNREQIYMKKDVLSLSGKTGRDITGRKERFILSWDNMTKTEFDSLLSSIETNTSMLFSISDGALQISETEVFAVVSSAEYSTLGSDYLVSTEVVLVEVT